MSFEYEVGIVGAGFAGLVAALKLKKAGKNSFIIFERGSEIGGTWRDNIYPGCACDIAVHLYSFADVPATGWSRVYAPQPEILAYLKNVASDYHLNSHIRLNADIVEAKFIKEEAAWLVTDRSGRHTMVRTLLLGLGPLNRPFVPRFSGLADFKGTSFHTSQWDKTFDPAGKNVAIIGTGASAIQVVPNIVSRVKQLVVFQRTAPWITNRSDKKISDTRKSLYKKFPWLQKSKREFFYWLNEFFGLGFMGNKPINRVMAWAALRKLRKEVKDPEMRRKLRPHYTIGCKRILNSDDYYPTFNKPNVSLVTEAIERFSAAGIVTTDGQEYAVDTAIFATGFVVADLDLYIKIIGLHNQNLVDEWKANGAEAYLGTTVSGYPNLAFLLGPNTGLGHNSIVHMIESQMNYIMQYIEYLEKGPGVMFLDLKNDVQDAYNERIQKQLQQTVWASGCKSWYVNARGKNTTLYPRLTLTFRKETKRFDPLAYHRHGTKISVSPL